MGFSKYTYCFDSHIAQTRGQLNFQGNNSKSLYTSFQSSLKRLKTEYIGV
jgi:aryl-alcohol dehydrogenase-like predicted oxidoreductase